MGVARWMRAKVGDDDDSDGMVASAERVSEG